MKDIRKVCIPDCENHCGLFSIEVNLEWVCPICGKPRGVIKKGRSYDGSLVLFCDTWENPCGHIDFYKSLRKEAKENGLNVGEKYEQV